ncbi:MAG: hypothetical protein LBS53_04430 [Synergistaceae bacterium]|jgi:hypothetical protein|nr:hypothetical protein [Synergistaceae bacterium]
MEKILGLKSGGKTTLGDTVMIFSQVNVSQNIENIPDQAALFIPSAAAVKNAIKAEAESRAEAIAAEAEIRQSADGALQESVGAKVDKISGKGLSSNDFTSAEKSKLAGLESSHFRGEFLSLAALQAIAGSAGDYAYVDMGGGADVTAYVWDATDSAWVEQKGVTTAETPASVKGKYETNPDTNAFTDADKGKLDGVEANANNYTHPSETARASGLYKITVNALGHVTAVTAVAKADITALGIPGSDTDTTYGAATTSAAGLMSAEDKAKLDDMEANAGNIIFKVGEVYINV